MTAKLGPWHWYVGISDDDDEMSQCDSREEAIARGRDEYATFTGGPFYIVEARFSASNERRLSNAKIDTAPFARTRNGKWIGKPL